MTTPGCRISKGNDYQYGEGAEEATQAVTEPPQATPVPQASPSPTPEPDVIVTARIAAAGDIVAHMPLNDDAYDSATGTYDYTHIYSDAKKVFDEADFCIADLETTFSGSGSYSGYPLFNSPDEFAKSLKESGIDMLNTANNHSMDSGFNGLVRTLDVLDEAGIDHVGTYRTREERDFNNGVVVKDICGISFAFLSYTYGTNGLPLASGREYSVNLFNIDYLTDLKTPDYELMGSDMEYARSLGADFIVVMMHWGWEYATKQNEHQEKLADYLFSEGADIILGGHVHVPQPMEIRMIANGDGTFRKGFISYCLGNFTSNQQDRYTNLTAIVNLEFEKNLTTGEAELKEASYVPMYMLHPSSDAGRYRLLDIYSALEAYEGGEAEEDDPLYAALVNGLADIHGIFGTELDCMNVN